MSICKKIECFSEGLVQQKLKKTEFMATCYHEAGHVVFGWLFKADIQIARVFAENNEGEVFFEPARTRSQRIANAYGAAGGPCAEAFYYKLMGKGGDPNFHHYCLWSSADFRITEFDDGAFSTFSNPYSTAVEYLLEFEKYALQWCFLLESFTRNMLSLGMTLPA